MTAAKAQKQRTLGQHKALLAKLLLGHLGEMVLEYFEILVFGEMELEDFDSR